MEIGSHKDDCSNKSLQRGIDKIQISPAPITTLDSDSGQHSSPHIRSISGISKPDIDNSAMTMTPTISTPEREAAEALMQMVGMSRRRTLPSSQRSEDPITILRGSVIKDARTINQDFNTGMRDLTKDPIPILVHNSTGTLSSKMDDDRMTIDNDTRDNKIQGALLHSSKAGSNINSSAVGSSTGVPYPVISIGHNINKSRANSNIGATGVDPYIPISLVKRQNTIGGRSHQSQLETTNSPNHSKSNKKMTNIAPKGYRVENQSGSNAITRTYQELLQNQGTRVAHQSGSNAITRIYQEFQENQLTPVLPSTSYQTERKQSKFNTKNNVNNNDNNNERADISDTNFQQQGEFLRKDNSNAVNRKLQDLNQHKLQSDISKIPNFLNRIRSTNKTMTTDDSSGIKIEIRPKFLQCDSDNKSAITITPTQLQNFESNPPFLRFVNPITSISSNQGGYFNNVDSLNLGNGNVRFGGANKFSISNSTGLPTFSALSLDYFTNANNPLVDIKESPDHSIRTPLTIQQPRVLRRRPLIDRVASKTIDVDGYKIPKEFWAKAFVQWDICHAAGILFKALFSPEEIQNCTLRGRNGTDQLDPLKRAAICRAVGWMKNKNQNPYSFDSNQLSKQDTLTPEEKLIIEKKVFVERRYQTSRKIRDVPSRKRGLPKSHAEKIDLLKAALTNTKPAFVNSETLVVSNKSNSDSDLKPEKSQILENTAAKILQGEITIKTEPPDEILDHDVLHKDSIPNSNTPPKSPVRIKVEHEEIDETELQMDIPEDQPTEDIKMEQEDDNKTTVDLNKSVHNTEVELEMETIQKPQKSQDENKDIKI